MNSTSALLASSQAVSPVSKLTGIRPCSFVFLAALVNRLQSARDRKTSQLGLSPRSRPVAGLGLSPPRLNRLYPGHSAAVRVPGQGVDRPFLRNEHEVSPGLPITHWCYI